MNSQNEVPKEIASPLPAGLYIGVSVDSQGPRITIQLGNDKSAMAANMSPSLAIAYASVIQTLASALAEATPEQSIKQGD